MLCDKRFVGRCCLIGVCILFAAPVQAGSVRVLGSHFRPDEPLPALRRFWVEKVDATANPGDKADLSVGGSLHMFVRNDSDGPVKMADLLVGGFSLTKALVFSDQRKDRKPASIYYANLPASDIEKLRDLGEPVWWKCDPPVIEPKGIAQVVVRLRSRPKPATVNMELRLSSGAVPAAVQVASAPPRVDGISFSTDRREVFLYFRVPGRSGRAPARILIDGEDSTALATIVKDPAVDVTPVVVRLVKALPEGSMHCFQGIYDDGIIASGAVRVLADEFGYGMWGGLPGKGQDVEGARAHVRDLAAKNINLQMPQVGSDMLGSFYNSEAGRRFCQSLGLRFVTNAPGKWGIKEPHAYFLKDEPDWADTRMKGLEPGHQVGSIGQYIVGTAYEMHKQDPRTPTFLNVNLGYKPLQWYTYGQLADIFASDPYYQPRLWDAYAGRPDLQKTYAKADWIYGVAAVAHAGGAPNPLHIILYGCRRGEGKFEDDPEEGPSKHGKRSTMNRWATPPEKRLEAYYAIAGGAKGLSYWWFTPGAKSDGMGAKHPEAKALWREVGLIGAELCTVGPVLVTSCPAAIAIKASPGLFAKTLLAGTDTLVLVVTNDEHRNTDKGTEIQPLQNAEVSVELPAWLHPHSVFSVNASGLHDVRTSRAATSLKVPLGTLDVARLILITGDVSLRGRLAELYKSRFAANVSKLMAAK